MVAPLFWEQEEQFNSDILHHPLWFVDIVWKSGNSEDACWKQINVLTTRKDCWLLYLSSRDKKDRQACNGFLFGHLFLPIEIKPRP